MINFLDMKFLLGEKERMTQIFEDDGRVVPVTVVKVSPATVIRTKIDESDGYRAVQLGFLTTSEKRLSKPEIGQRGGQGNFKYLKEFRLTGGATQELKPGEIMEVSALAVGDRVTITAISKGKGFQGVVKRHGFAGGPRSHGQKHSEREAGSIGATGPQRVLKGKKMAGRMGGDKITIRGVKVVRSLPAEGVVMLKGAIPGRTGTLIKISG